MTPQGRTLTRPQACGVCGVVLMLSAWGFPGDPDMFCGACGRDLGLQVTIQ